MNLSISPHISKFATPFESYEVRDSSDNNYLKTEMSKTAKKICLIVCCCRITRPDSNNIMLKTHVNKFITLLTLRSAYNLQNLEVIK